MDHDDEQERFESYCRLESHDERLTAVKAWLMSMLRGDVLTKADIAMVLETTIKNIENGRTLLYSPIYGVCVTPRRAVESAHPTLTQATSEVVR